MSCYLLLRNFKTGDAVGLATCDFGTNDKRCIECMFDEEKQFKGITTSHISQAEYGTYKALNLFREYSWDDSTK